MKKSTVTQMIPKIIFRDPFSCSSGDVLLNLLMSTLCLLDSKFVNIHRQAVKFKRTFRFSRLKTDRQLLFFGFFPIRIELAAGPCYFIAQ